MKKAQRYISDEIEKHISAYKRNKICENSPGFVASLELLVAELKQLEEIGVEVQNKCLKGTIACFTFDNLGGNELSSDECSRSTRENPANIRKLKDYNEQLSKLKDSNSHIHIHGVKKPCLLNNLNHFHILQNRTVDLMHDVLEGVIPNLFEISITVHC